MVRTPTAAAALAALALGAATALAAAPGGKAPDPPAQPTAAAAVAAKPAPARAGLWTGTKVQYGLRLTFRVGKGGTKVTDFAADVYERCTGESTTSLTTVAPEAAYPVRGRAFGKKTVETVSGIKTHYTIKGRFTGAGTATGTLRMESAHLGTVCDTLTLKWTAKAGGRKA